MGDEVKPFEAKLETRDNKSFWSTKPLEDVEINRVANLVNEGLTVRDIAEDTSLSRAKVGRLRKKAEALGLIKF